MTPAETLDSARDLLTRRAGTGVGSWPRAVALLTRQALEKGVDAFWITNPATAGLAACPMRTQLICLPSYLDPAIAYQVGFVWAALSGACHYHPYELAPTASQLNGWIEIVARLLATLSLAE
jgi:hypothetical protein